MSVNINFPNFIEVNALDTSDATATESDIAVGKTAYVNGVKVTGTLTPVVQTAEFSTAGQLTSVVLPDTITSIGDEAFYCCKSLESITIPNTVTSIGADAFYYCSNLANIYFKGTETQWNAISKGSYWNEKMGTSVSGGTVIHYNS